MPYLALLDEAKNLKAYVLSSDDEGGDKKKLIDYLIEEHGWSTMEVSSKPRPSTAGKQKSRGKVTRKG